MTTITTNQLNLALLAPVTAKPAIAKDANIERIEETAREFESMFLSEMMKPMFETVGVNDMFGGGQAEEMWRGFLRDEYGKMLAGVGSLGIADQVKEELIAMQEKAAQQKASQPAVAQNMHGTLKSSTGESNV